MERYLQIGKENLKYHLPPYLLISILMLALAPLFMGMKNLDAQGTAKIIDMYASLAGIILLTPVFVPEQNKDLRDMIKSRYTSMAAIYTIRLMQAMAALGIWMGALLIILKMGNCTFPALPYYWSGYATALFLGSLGVLACSLADNVVIGYMIPMIYYMINIGYKNLGWYHLFSLTYEDYVPKICLGITGLVLLIPAVAWRQFRRTS